MTKEEFNKQVIPLGEKLYRLAFRLLENSESAKDVLQESFLKLWEIRSELKKLSSIEAYATTIVKNKCLDKIKLKKKTLNINYLKDESEKPESNYDMKEGYAEIKKIIETLPKQQKIIIELRDIEGYSNEEVADILDLSVNNIRVQLSFARKRIKEELVKVYNYGISQN